MKAYSSRCSRPHSFPPHLGVAPQASSLPAVKGSRGGNYRQGTKDRRVGFFASFVNARSTGIMKLDKAIKNKDRRVGGGVGAEGVGEWEYERRGAEPGGAKVDRASEAKMVRLTGGIGKNSDPSCSCNR